MVTEAVTGAPGSAGRGPKGGGSRNRGQLVKRKEAEGYSRAFNHLCHTVSLTRLGKTRDAIDSLAATVFVVHGGEELKTAEDVAQAIDGWFGIALPTADVQRSLDRQQSAGRLRRDRDGGRLLGLVGLDTARLERPSTGMADLSCGPPPCSEGGEFQ